MNSQMHFISLWAQQNCVRQQPDGPQSGSVTLGKVVAALQREEGAAAVRALLPKRSWEKMESILTQHPGRVLGAWATAFAGCNSLSLALRFVLLSPPFLRESISC